MIRKIPYSTLNLKSLSSLSHQLVTIVEKNHADELMLSGMLKSIKDAMAKATLAVNAGPEEDISEQIVALDAKRDDTFVSLRNHIDAGLLRHRSPEYQQACKRLSEVFANNGRLLYKLSHDEQSDAMQALFQDLSTPQAMQDLSAIYALDWLGELKKDQEDFEALYHQRSEGGHAEDMPRDDEAFKDLKIALENLIILMNAFEISRQVPNLDNTIEFMNECIDQMLSSL